MMMLEQRVDDGEMRVQLSGFGAVKSAETSESCQIQALQLQLTWQQRGFVLGVTWYDQA